MQLCFYQDSRHSWVVMNSRFWIYCRICNSERNWVQKSHGVILPDCPACPFCNCYTAALMVVADWLGTLGRYVRKKISQNCRHYTVCTITHTLGNNISSQTWKKCKKNKTVAVLCRFVWLNSIVSECATANHLELTRQIELFSMVELKET